MQWIYSLGLQKNITFHCFLYKQDQRDDSGTKFRYKKTSLFCIGRSAVNWNDLLSLKGGLVSHLFPDYEWVALAAGSTHKMVKWMDWLVNVLLYQL